ncbi:MAG: hypothetical protein RPU42_04205, partial [Candidatus Sedimenticola sp. (ex Thyasira tokunagai)]
EFLRKLPEAVVGSLLMVLIAAVSVTVGTVAVFGWTGALLNFADVGLVGDEDILLSVTVFANLLSCLFSGAGFFAVSDDVGCSVERLEWEASFAVTTLLTLLIGLFFTLCILCFSVTAEG